MQRVGIVSVFYQCVGYFLCFEPGAAEDDAVYAGIVVGNTFQGQIFVFGVYEIVDVFYILCPFVFAADNDFPGRMHVFFCDTAYVGRHGGREKQHTSFVWNSRKYFVDTFGKSHVEHLVGFVHNHGMYPVELYHTSVDQVDEAAGCSDDYVYAFFECTYLAFDARSPVYGKNFQPVDMRRVIVEVASYLQAQFAGGAENECLGLIDRKVGFLYDRQTECCRFSRTCLCKGDDVGFFIEQQRNYFFLYGHGMFIPEFGNGFENFGTYAQFFESLHK